MIGRQAGPSAYEFTIAGPMGPLLRAAFPEHRFAAIDPCTVIRLRVPPDRDLDLVDLVGLFASAGILVQDLYRVCPGVAPPRNSPPASAPRVEQTMSSGPGEARHATRADAEA